MLVFFINALKIIFLLGLLVFIHEGGHFLTAKLCKVKVNEFALGFGPRIFKIKGKETTYSLRLIPLGGFVNMEGEEERSEKEGSFSKTSISKRIAIVAAGGIVNIIFGLIVYFILTTTNESFITNKIDYLADGYNAQTIGLQQNDEILKINGKKVVNNVDIQQVLQKNKGENVKLLVKRNENLIEYEVTPNENKYKETGMFFRRESFDTKIAMVEPNSPAEIQGIKANDIVVKINDIDVKDNIQKLLEVINNKSVNEELKIVVLRHGSEKIFFVKPEEKKIYQLGIVFKNAENTLFNRTYYSFYDTLHFIESIVDNLKELFSGKILKNQLMGPVGITSEVSNIVRN